MTIAPALTREEVQQLMEAFIENTTPELAREYMTAVTNSWWAGNITGEEMRTHVNVMTTSIPTMELNK